MLAILYEILLGTADRTVKMPASSATNPAIKDVIEDGMQVGAIESASLSIQEREE